MTFFVINYQKWLMLPVRCHMDSQFKQRAQAKITCHNKGA